ncbi:MAG: hypothetical protein ABC378_13130 [Staphylococcus pseudoxylosus]|uniref:hypothetical protein n=1 Tax=Staphylococcus pseudoxylosus TaxID=2282419 RepID=UPI0031F60A46
MVKIKRQVEMTIEEYAKHMIDKYGIRCFESELIDDNIIDAPMKFKQVFELNPVLKSDLLNGSFRNGKTTVEVEKEITEDTAFNMLVALYKYPRLQKIFSHRDNTSIRQFKDLEDDIVSAIYMVNDDSTMTLIWRDGKLVE